MSVKQKNIYIQLLRSLVTDKRYDEDAANSLVQKFEIGYPFFTTVPVQIVFLYAFFERD